MEKERELEKVRESWRELEKVRLPSPLLSLLSRPWLSPMRRPLPSPMPSATAIASSIATDITVAITIVFNGTFFRVFTVFQVFSDFLGRLQPSKTTIQQTLGTLGVEKSSSPRTVLHFYTSNSSRGRMRAELWRFKVRIQECEIARVNYPDSVNSSDC